MTDRRPAPSGPSAGFDAEAELLLTLARQGELRGTARERLARLCACCHRIYVEGHLVRHVCDRCHSHVRCGHCGRDFDPGPDSFALLCPDCWPAVRTLVQTMHEHGSQAERSELRHQMYLAFEPRFACRWREDGRAAPSGAETG